MQQLPSQNPAAYGDQHAPMYDRIYGARFRPEVAVGQLAAAGRDSGVLELGVGTGRLAVPLAARGIRVDGIEASPAMVGQLRARPGRRRGRHRDRGPGRLRPARKGYGAAMCAVSTLFMLPHASQRSCIAAAARHLRPRGTLFIEAPGYAAGAPAQLQM